MFHLVSIFLKTEKNMQCAILREPTPILRDLRFFFGFDQVPIDATYPLTIELDPRCMLHTLLTDILAGPRVFDFDPSERVPDMKVWVYVPHSVETCYERLISFLGFFYLRLYYKCENTGKRMWHDIYHGSYYLPVGCFVRDADLRVLGRVVVRGKEKYFTTFEGISSDIPCVCRDNGMASLKYAKIVRSKKLQLEKQEKKPQMPPQTAAAAAAAAPNGSGKGHRELWDRSFDGSSRLVKQVARKISCTFKAYHSTNHTPVNVVHGMTSNGTRITSLCTYSPHAEHVLVTRNDYEEYLSRPENAGVTVPIAVAVMQYDSCVSGFKGVTNTNSYVYKTIKQPSQILADHVLKCVRKNFRTKCLVPPNTGIETLKKILCINHTNINSVTNHYSRFVLSATCESLFAAVSNEHRTVVNFYKTNKQSYMRQLQSTQMGYVSATATPDGADIGMSKHLTFGTTYTVRMPDFFVREARERVLSLLSSRVRPLDLGGVREMFLAKLFPPRDDRDDEDDDPDAPPPPPPPAAPWGDGACVLFFNNKPCAIYVPSTTAPDEKPAELVSLAASIPCLHIHYERMAALYLFWGMSGKLQDRLGLAQSNAVFRGIPGSGRCLTDHANPWSKHNDAVRNTLGFSMIKQAVSKTATVHNSEMKRVLNSGGSEYIRASILPLAMGHCVEDGMVISRSFANRAVYMQTKHASVANNLRGATITYGAPPPSLVPYECSSLWALPRGAPIVYGEPVIAVRLPKPVFPLENNNNTGGSSNGGGCATDSLYLSTRPQQKRRKTTNCIPPSCNGGDEQPKFAVILFGKRSHYNFTFQSCHWYSAGGMHSKVVYTISRAMTPTYGYKFATVHGQKGVVCKVLEDGEMPRGVVTGTVPDVIVHPNTLLSRLTIGQLLEDAEINNRVRERYVIPTLGGCTTAHELEPHDVTLFHQRNVPEDKFHMRDKMAVFNIFTRQPMEGRANEGSARMGEMECSAFMATGATVSLSNLGHSSLPDCDSRAIQCSVCGRFRVCGDENGIGRCQCDSEEGEPEKKEEDIAKLELVKKMKYAGSLSTHILNAMRVGVRINYVAQHSGSKK